MKCFSCKQDVIVIRNQLIEKHLIWKNLSKLYGIKNLSYLKTDVEFLSCKPLLDDIQVRHTRILSRYNTFIQKVNDVESRDQSFNQLGEELEHILNVLKNRLNGLSKIDDRSNQYKKTLNTFDVIQDSLVEVVEGLLNENNSIPINTSDSCILYLPKETEYSSYRQYTQRYKSLNTICSKMVRILRTIYSKS